MNSNAAVKALKEAKNLDGTYKFSRNIIPDERYVKGFFGYLTRKRKIESMANNRGKNMPADIDEAIENLSGDREMDILKNVNEMDDTDVLQESVRSLKKRSQPRNT